LLFALVALATTPSLAGEIVIQTRLPVEVVLDDAHLATLLAAGELIVPAEAGPHKLTLWVGGNPRDIQLDVPSTGHVAVAVGRAGVTTDVLPDAQPDPATPAVVALRCTGVETLQVVLGTERYTLDPGVNTTVSLAAGKYPLSLRNDAGTVVWADGTLVLEPGGTVVVHVADGRAPEVLGRGGVFRPKG
jgi:hypothetical protein